MRILHTEWSDGWGGQERRIMSDLAGMAGRGHQVYLATRRHCRIGEEARRAGIPVIHLPMRGNLDLASVMRLAGWLRKEKIDVVNTHSGVDSWVGGLAAKLAGTPALVRTRHLHLPLKRGWLNFVHYLPDRIAACGESTRDFLVGECGFPRQAVVSIPTGIDFPRFAPQRKRAQVRADLALPQDAFLVLMVGIIRAVKRHEVALRALQHLTGRIDAHLAVAGDGPMMQDMKRLAEELGIAGRVHFLGHRDDVADLMGAADCLLLTSRSEGVPQAVTQALGLGLPVVATAVGGVPELVKDGQTGLLVPAENPDAAAAALEHLARHPETARELARNGRAHALAHYSLQAMLDKTEQEYRAVLREKGRA
ncbi:MAG: glycosyltransferase [Sulfuricella sp.]|jgi:glycosyltransferase involved in cell wall biosynthesis|nr:glycosyltransferase [Sulfuricella sp.]